MLLPQLALVAWLAGCHQRHQLSVLDDWPWRFPGTPRVRAWYTYHRLDLVKVLWMPVAKLMPDKKDFGYAFPRRSWSRRHLRLPLGSLLPSYVLDAQHLGWVTFYWHWKHLGI